MGKDGKTPETKEMTLIKAEIKKGLEVLQAYIDLLNKLDEQRKKVANLIIGETRAVQVLQDVLKKVDGKEEVRKTIEEVAKKE